MSSTLDAALPAIAMHYFEPSPFIELLLDEPYIIRHRVLLHVKHALFVKSRKTREFAFNELMGLEKLTTKSAKATLDKRKVKFTTKPVRYE